MLVVLSAAAFPLGCDDSAPTDPIPPPPFNGPLIDLQPAWSPDGSQIAYVHRSIAEADTSGIYIIDVGGENAVPRLVLADSLGEPKWLSFSPDGASISYWLGGDIWTVDQGTRESLRVTSGGNKQNPHWHPSEPLILFNRVFAEADPGNIRFLDLRTGESQPIRQLDGSVLDGGGKARWNATGDMIVYTTAPASRRGAELFVLNPSGSMMTQITVSNVVNSEPHWYSTGELVFNRAEGGKNRTYIIGADGTNLRVFPSAGAPIGYLGQSFDCAPHGRLVTVSAPDAENEYGVLWIIEFDNARETSRRQITEVAK